jgi:hypothetical protein
MDGVLVVAQSIAWCANGAKLGKEKVTNTADHEEGGQNEQKERFLVKLVI